jgi:SAM-dependent MidA family methyltransferase
MKMKLEMLSSNGLPEPSDMDLVKSNRVSRFIDHQIEKTGNRISFRDFMQYALYEEDLGYYASKKEIIGVNGDFITAPEYGEIFSNSIAKQCAVIINEIKGATILEYGAGTGALAVGILKKLSDMGCMPEHYLIIEISANLINHQKRKLKEEIPELTSIVSWISSVPEEFSGIVIANEVADAFPFERFVRTDNQVLQVCIAKDKEKFEYDLIPADKKLCDYVLSLEKIIGRKLDHGYLSEVSFEAQDWVKEIACKIKSGVFFILDYGVSRNEYYSPNRNQGWTRCHFMHHAHNEPLIYPGIQDITTWVDFSILSEIATDNGMKINGFLNQSQFIINSGIEESFHNFDQLELKAQIELSRQIKLLTLPDQMGENFKCLGLSKNFILNNNLFKSRDRAYVL